MRASNCFAGVNNGTGQMIASRQAVEILVVEAWRAVDFDSTVVDAKVGRDTWDVDFTRIFMLKCRLGVLEASTHLKLLKSCSQSARRFAPNKMTKSAEASRPRSRRR